RFKSSFGPADNPGDGSKTVELLSTLADRGKGRSIRRPRPVLPSNASFFRLRIPLPASGCPFHTTRNRLGSIRRPRSDRADVEDVCLAGAAARPRVDVGGGMGRSRAG